jgi:hypothetical protein
MPSDPPPPPRTRSPLRIGIALALLALLALALALVVSRVLAPRLLPLEEGFEPEATGPLPPPATEPTPAERPPAVIADGPPPDDEAATVPEKRRRPRERGAPTPPDEPAATGGGIVRDGPGSYVVSRSFAERSMEDGSGIGGSHAVPHVVDGRTVGYRLTNAGGMLGRLGLRAGDVLVAANGAPLTSADAALGAFGRLRRADHLRITVLRGGSPVTLRYRVVD